MPALADPNVGPEPILPDPWEETRAEVRRLRERWAHGEELAGAEAERLEVRLAAAAEVAKKSRGELDAAIEAKRAAEAAKTEPAPAPVPEPAPEPAPAEEKEPIR